MSSISTTSCIYDCMMITKWEAIQLQSYHHLIFWFILNLIADLRTMSKRVESEQYYVTFEMFMADVKRMFHNARTYNSPDTIYYKCSMRHDIICFILNGAYFRLLILTLRKTAGWKHTFKAKFNQVCNLAPKFSSKLVEDTADYTFSRRSIYQF